MRLALNNTLNSITSKEFSNNYSMDFEGTNEYLEASSLADSFPVTGSISFWVKSDFSSHGINDGDIFDKYDGVDFRNHIFIRNYTDSTLQCACQDDSDPASGYRASGIITVIDDQWNHVVVTWDTTSASEEKFKGYLNGNTTPVFNANIDVSGGWTPDGQVVKFGGDGYEGLMDEVAIWDAVLDGDTIGSIYNSGTPNDLTLSASYTAGSGVDKSGNLLSYWRMGDGIYDSGSGEVIFDQETPTIGENLITDPIFATGTGWTASGGTGIISERSTEKPQSGDYSWKFETNGYDENKGVTTPAITVDANTVYRFSYWAYAPDTNSSRWMNISSTGWVRLGTALTHTGRSIPTDTWTEVFGYFRTDSGTSSVAVRFGNGGSAGADGDLRYFDNVSMVKIGGNPAIMKNMDSSNIVTDTP